MREGDGERERIVDDPVAVGLLTHLDEPVAVGLGELRALDGHAEGPHGDALVGEEAPPVEVGDPDLERGGGGHAEGLREWERVCQRE